MYVDNSKMAQFGASIYLGGPWDWEPENGGPSRCQRSVDNAVKQGINYIQFVPTFYWWDDGPRQPWPAGFDPSCKDSNLTTYYCYSRFNSTTVDHWCYTRQDGNCPEVSSQEIESLKTNLGNCMKVSVQRSVDKYILARAYQ